MKFTVDAESADEFTKLTVNVLSGFYTSENGDEVCPICRKLLITELPLPLTDVKPILPLDAASPLTNTAE